jgi:hypothetical protein
VIPTVSEQACDLNFSLRSNKNFVSWKVQLVEVVDRTFLMDVSNPGTGCLYLSRSSKEAIRMAPIDLLFGMTKTVQTA